MDTSWTTTWSFWSLVALTVDETTLPKLICQEVEVFDRSSGEPWARPVRLRVPVGRASDEETIGELKTLLAAHPGASEVFLQLGDRRVLRLPGRVLGGAG